MNEENEQFEKNLVYQKDICFFQHVGRNKRKLKKKNICVCKERRPVTVTI
jgi:hypothetical protein